MTDEQIELCLKRLSECKTSDVMNFSYADALAYIERLKAENAELRARLTNERRETKKRRLALDYACLDMVSSDECWLDNFRGKIAFYLNKADELIGDKKAQSITFMFHDVRVTELKEEKQ